VTGTEKMTDEAVVDSQDESPKVTAPEGSSETTDADTSSHEVAKETLEDIQNRCDKLKSANKELKKDARKAVRRYRREQALKPYQAELIRMQQYLETSGTRMIILFEGRDAAGKGGTIRRVTR
jgi:polyphosphate kinase 2 (PPK2 family)